MKNVLITGANSFVGSSVKRYLETFPDKYTVSAVGMKNGEWRNLSFSAFDSVYHVAGLAHADVGKVSDDIKKKYYAINTDLAIEVAKKAKAEGVKQFIFMSSSIVYGDSAPIGKQKVISSETACSPSNFYGDSKVKAEEGLLQLEDKCFKVVILRCPMVYGKGGKGNFPVLEKIAQKTPIFPRVKNERSMLYIGNLAEFVRLMIENEESGIFWPCNKELSNTSELVRMIAECHGKNVVLVPGFTWALRSLSLLTGYVNKAFGSLTYDRTISEYKEEYRLFTMEESIERTER